MARRRWSFQCGTPAPRSQKPPCSQLRPGSRDRSFDLLGRTGTQGCFHRSDPQHCCTAVWALPCKPLSQQEHTPRGSPGGEKCLMMISEQVFPGNTDWTTILLRGSIGWDRGDVVGLTNLGGDNLAQEHL